MQVSTDFIVVKNSEQNVTELNAKLEFHENANSNETEGPITTLKNLRLKKHHGIIIAYLNINSIRNKFDFLKVIISSNIDILTIAETKLDDAFPTSQFMLDGFHSPFRYDRNRYGGGILVYVKHGVPAKELKEYQLPGDIECGFVEINIKKKKWLLANIYRPPSQGERYFSKN